VSRAIDQTARRWPVFCGRSPLCGPPQTVSSLSCVPFSLREQLMVNTLLCNTLVIYIGYRTHLSFPISDWPGSFSWRHIRSLLYPCGACPTAYSLRGNQTSITVNLYVASDTVAEEGSPEGTADIPGEGLSDLESIHQQGDQHSDYIAGWRGRLEEDCSEEKALSGTTDSQPVIRVTRGRDQTGTNSTIGVPPRERAGTWWKEKKRPVSTKLILCKVIIN